MRLGLVLYFALQVFGSFGLAVQPSDVGNQAFTIGSVRVGATTKTELEQLGAVAIDDKKYDLKGNYFWVNPSNSLVYSYMRGVNESWPSTWRDLKILPSLTKKDVLKWIERYGFRASVQTYQIDGVKISPKDVYVIKFYFDEKEKLSQVVLLCTPRP